MPHTVCTSCKTLTAEGWTACPSCGGAEVTVYAERWRAEAALAAVWLSEGWSIADVSDRYWAPRR